MIRSHFSLAVKNFRSNRFASTDAYNAALLTLKKDLKQAMISKDDLKKTTIRGLLSAIKNREIDNHGKEFDEYMLYETFSKLVKQRNDSIKDFLKNGRDDLVGKEKQELNLVQKYMNDLPVSSREEIDANVLAYLNELKTSNPNLQMKEVFSIIDWEHKSNEWKAPTNTIKSSIAGQYRKVFA